MHFFNGTLTQHFLNMTKRLHILLILFCIVAATPSVFGQHRKRVKRSNGQRFSFFDSDVDSLENKTMEDGFFYLGSHYMNHVNSLGRDNGINQWALSPVAGFQKNNLDVYVNNFRWSATDPRWAETDIGISKQWTLPKPWTFVTTYEHAFIKYGSEEDRYGLNNSLSNQFGWQNKYFEVDARYEYDWGTSCASILELSIGRQFNFYDVFVKDKVEITPRFYISYLGGNTYPVRWFNRNPPCDVDGAKGFQLANYELELPFTWRKVGNVECNIALHFAAPKNVVVPDEGSGNASFYLTSSLIKILKTKHKKRPRTS